MNRKLGAYNSEIRRLKRLPAERTPSHVLLSLLIEHFHRKILLSHVFSWGRTAIEIIISNCKLW
jgi:hypothetical protein